MKRKLLLVAGARPNFMKIAPIARTEEHAQRYDYKINHTGQHYDREMSELSSRTSSPFPRKRGKVRMGATPFPT